MNNEIYIRTIKTFIGLMMLVIAISFWPKNIHQNYFYDSSTKTAQSPKDFFGNISVSAKSVFVYDLSTNKILFSKNETEALPLASLTKIMTAFTASNMAPNETLVTIDGSSIKTEGDSGLLKDEEWTLKNLLQYTLVGSSNDGAVAVASSIGAIKENNLSREENFVAEMNNEAEKLGLSSMKFNNPSGLDLNDKEAGAYGSAKDTAILLAKAVEKNPDIFEPTRYPSFKTASIANAIHKTKNTNELANEIPGFVAGKTGYSDLAGGNLAIIFDAGIGHDVVISVLGSTPEGRFEDMKQLINASISTITQKPYNQTI